MKKIAIGFSFFFLWFSNLQAQAPFYEGKTIRIVVELPAGDAYDLYSRLLAEHMGKYIPGNPNIIVQNMAGASTMIAANYVYNVAKPDGLTFGLILPSLYFDQLVGRKEVQFDWPKVTCGRQLCAGRWRLGSRADRPLHDGVQQRGSSRSESALPCGLQILRTLDKLAVHTSPTTCSRRLWSGEVSLISFTGSRADFFGLH